MKSAYVVVLLFIVCIALASGCISQAEYFKNATFGSSFYDYNRVHYWKDNIVMHGGGVNSTWNMTVYVKNDTLNGTPAMYMKIITEGNGMNITYDVWCNATTRSVLKMHAKGTQGKYFQDRDTSTLQLQTLPDVGFTYYSVPFWPIKNYTANTADGHTIPVTVYSASDNKGLSVTYVVSPVLPVPIRVAVVQNNISITETLIDYE